MKIDDHWFDQDVMTCPACRQMIAAKVSIRVTPGKASLQENGKVTLPLATELTRFNVSHVCNGPIEATESEPTS